MAQKSSLRWKDSELLPTGRTGFRYAKCVICFNNDCFQLIYGRILVNISYNLEIGLSDASSKRTVQL